KPVSKDLNQKIIEQSSTIVGTALEKTIDAVSGVFLIFTVLVLTIYMLLDFHNIRKFMASLLPKKEEGKALEVLKEIETKLGAWLRGELLLMTVIGTLTYIGLFALDIDYALSLALIAGILEIVPMIGPTIALVPALIVGFSTSPVHGFGILGLYIVIQQLENNLIVPKIMQKSVGFNPLVTLIAIILGGSLFGVLGSLLAVPATLVITIIARNYIKL
ncbi:AI-2E family transporter, partial [Patescibacteria group bacterium]|nr:AI-2E family transporter [Patescibacteria group bacterium]